MSTPSSVIFQFEDSEGGEAYKGVRVNFDGYPSGVGNNLRALIERDGVDNVREQILSHPDWSSIDIRTDHDGPDRRDRYAITGYGDYYLDTDKNPEYYLLPYIDENWRDHHNYLVTRTGKVLWASSPMEPWADIRWRDDWSEDGDNDND